MTFYLGTHMTGWLSHAGVPLFVSHRRLARLRTLPRAAAPWALDSGGFTELSMHGRWQTAPAAYAAAAERYQAEIGRLDWAAPQDWMCEPFILAGTRKTVPEHQALTVESVLTLRSLAPSVPWAPVLQGWHPDDYLAHAERYAAAGIDLGAEPVVGVGSVCRRQGTRVAFLIFYQLALLGLKLHGFGLKVLALRKFARLLASADSLAWSYAARRSPPLPGCPHQSCANCLVFARRWRDGVCGLVSRPRPSFLGVR